MYEAHVRWRPWQMLRFFMVLRALDNAEELGTRIISIAISAALGVPERAQMAWQHVYIMHSIVHVFPYNLPWCATAPVSPAQMPNAG